MNTIINKITTDLPNNKQLELIVLKARRRALLTLIEQASELNIELESQINGLIYNNIEELETEISDYE